MTIIDKDQSIKIKKLVDGFGTQAVSDWLTGDLSNQHFKVKNATYEDMDSLGLANDKKVRNNSLNKEYIPWDSRNGFK